MRAVFILANVFYMIVVSIAIFFLFLSIHNVKAEGLVFDPYYGWVAAPRGYRGARMPGVWERHGPIEQPAPPPPLNLPIVPQPMPEPPPMTEPQPQPQPLGTVYGNFITCEPPHIPYSGRPDGCVISVHAHGANVRDQHGQAFLALVNGTPVTVLGRAGELALIAVPCQLQSTGLRSDTHGVPLMVCQ